MTKVGGFLNQAGLGGGKEGLGSRSRNGHRRGGGWRRGKRGVQEDSREGGGWILWGHLCAARGGMKDRLRTEESVKGRAVILR